MHTALKINVSIYRNFDEIFATIDLPEIKSYKVNTLKYLLLVFTGKIKNGTNLIKMEK